MHQRWDDPAQMHRQQIPAHLQVVLERPSENVGLTCAQAALPDEHAGVLRSAPLDWCAHADMQRQRRVAYAGSGRVRLSPRWSPFSASFSGRLKESKLLSISALPELPHQAGKQALCP